MTKQALVILVIAFGFNFSASAGKNPRIDQALMENLAEKQTLNAELSKHQAPVKAQVNSRYRAVEILEVGDELGGFANSNGRAEDVE